MILRRKANIDNHIENSIHDRMGMKSIEKYRYYFYIDVLIWDGIQEYDDTQFNSNPYPVSDRVGSANYGFPSPSILCKGPFYPVRGSIRPQHLVPCQLGSTLNSCMVLIRSSSSRCQTTFSMFAYLMLNICHPEALPEVLIFNPNLQETLPVSFWLP